MLIFIGADEIRATLSYQACIDAMHSAMTRLSSRQTEQMLRNILPLEDGRMFGVMAGTLGPGGAFGSKLVSVTPQRKEGGPPSHQGAVVIFDPKTGAPVCQLEAGMLTAIRTASASALATNALARPDARILTILGTGEQAYHHGRALATVRELDEIRIWGRNPVKATALATELSAETGIACIAFEDARQAAFKADIICTVTASSQPVLLREWVTDGTHINVVGSSFDGPREIDDALVATSRFYADSSDSVRAQGAEFRHALASGVIEGDHLLGEIGEVLIGTVVGRTDAADITIYKSLGHIAQDISAGHYVYEELCRRAPE